MLDVGWCCSCDRPPLLLLLLLLAPLPLLASDVCPVGDSLSPFGRLVALGAEVAAIRASSVAVVDSSARLADRRAFGGLVLRTVAVDGSAVAGTGIDNNALLSQNIV